MAEDDRTFSIGLHLRRTIIEDAFVAVPVTEKIMLIQDDGTGKINFEAFVAEAIRISADPRVEWKNESLQVEPHPIQCPLPEDRHSFDAFYDVPS